MNASSSFPWPISILFLYLSFKASRSTDWKEILRFVKRIEENCVHPRNYELDTIKDGPYKWEVFFFPDNDYVRQVYHIRGYWIWKRKLGGKYTFFRDNCASIWKNNAEWAFFLKNDEKLIHVNWHECNDNCNTVSKQVTNDNITTALYTSFFEISAQLGSYQQLPLSTRLPQK